LALRYYDEWLDLDHIANAAYLREETLTLHPRLLPDSLAYPETRRHKRFRILRAFSGKFCSAPQVAVWIGLPIKTAVTTGWMNLPKSQHYGAIDCISKPRLGVIVVLP